MAALTLPDAGPVACDVTIGTPATAFATLINAGPADAHGCRLSAPGGVPARFAPVLVGERGATSVPVVVP